LARTRILHIITQLGVGGAENQLLALCAQLPAEQFECRVISLVAGGSLRPRFEMAGVSVCEIDRRTSGGPAGQLVAIMREIRVWRPDVVHTWLHKANHVGRIAATLSTRRPVVACFRDMGHQTSGGDTILDRLLDPRTQLSLHNSEAGRRAFLSRVGDAREDRHRLLRNGIDCERFRPDPAARARLRCELGIPEDDPVVIMVSRLQSVKDPGLFLAVARRVRRDLPTARFWLVGGGPLEDDLRRSLAESPDPGIWISGEREDIPGLLASSDLALLTSYSEGLSNAILEAMSCGLPVAATAVGGNCELVAVDETGVLLQDRDPEAVAGIVAPLLRSPEDRMNMGRAGRLAVEERFSLAAMITAAASHYQWLVGI